MYKKTNKQTKNQLTGVLIMYPATLVSCVLSSFLVDSLPFFICRIMSISRNIFTSFILIWIHFMTFSWLIALARTSRTMLTHSGETDFLALFLILGRKLSVFYHYDVSCGFFHKYPLSCWRIISLSLVFWEF